MFVIREGRLNVIEQRNWDNEQHNNPPKSRMREFEKLILKKDKTNQKIKLSSLIKLKAGSLCNLIMWKNLLYDFSRRREE